MRRSSLFWPDQTEIIVLIALAKAHASLPVAHFLLMGTEGNSSDVGVEHLPPLDEMLEDVKSKMASEKSEKKQYGDPKTRIKGNHQGFP